jgi:hypothetical protein
MRYNSIFWSGNLIGGTNLEEEGAEERVILRYKHNSVALVREQTIPIELPPLVGEVSTNFCG